jgi:acylphosphatase
MRVRRLAITVTGRVQGVGFRFFVYDCARTFSLTGWVRNTTDGSIAIEVQGFSNALDAFIAEVNEGPAHARVVEVLTVEVSPRDGEEGFEILY